MADVGNVRKETTQNSDGSQTADKDNAAHDPSIDALNGGKGSTGERISTSETQPKKQD